jgi:CRP-like cAMP-binding protein
VLSLWNAAQGFIMRAFIACCVNPTPGPVPALSSEAWRLTTQIDFGTLEHKARRFVWPLRTFADSLTRATQKAEADAEADAEASAAPEDTAVAREGRARLVQRARLSAALEAMRVMLPTLDDDDAQALVADGLSWRDLQEGETMFEQGDAADAVYVVLSGVVNVSTRDPFSALDVAAHQPTSSASPPDGSSAELPPLSPLTNLSLTPRTNLSFSPRSSLHLDSPRSAAHSSTVSPRPSMHMASPRMSGTYSALWQAALPTKPVHFPASHVLARVLRPGELLGELVSVTWPSAHVGGKGPRLDDSSRVLSHSDRWSRHVDGCRTC